MFYIFLVVVAIVVVTFFNLGKNKPEQPVKEVDSVFVDINTAFENIITRNKLTAEKLEKLDKFIKNNEKAILKTLIEYGWIKNNSTCSYAAWQLVGWDLLVAKKKQREQNQDKSEPGKPNQLITRKEHCFILGINETSDMKLIKKAYYSKMNRYHPDKFIHATEAQRENATRETMKIMNSYKYLKNLKNN